MYSSEIGANRMDESVSPDLILYNARVVTLNPIQPDGELVAVKGSRILYTGRSEDLAWMKGRQTETIDCNQHTLIPGFVDAHCHVLGYSASLVAVDCSPRRVRSISDLKGAIEKKAAETPPESWIRGTGYNEFYLDGGRHPNRWDLDEVSPGNPVKLSHRSGHATVLNSLGLRLAGIDGETPDPPDGIIHRDPDTGEPTGLLFEMEPHLERVVPRLEESDLLEGLRIANESFVSRGVTSIQDATASNGIEQWTRFDALKKDGVLDPRITLMPGAQHLKGFVEEGASSGWGNDDVNLGHVKLMVTETTGIVQPPIPEIGRLISEAEKAGFPVAIHAIERAAIEAAVTAIEETSLRNPNAGHRIEHCSECAPNLISRIAKLGVRVVTQPGFIYHSGERYLSEVPTHKQQYLYPLKSLLRAGVLVAAGSDAPVTPPDPIIGMYASITRRCASREALSLQEGVTSREALMLQTINGAYASRQERVRGSIEAGKQADVVLLDKNPLTTAPEELGDIQVLLTMVGGQVVFER